jgi:FdhD protein
MTVATPLPFERITAMGSLEPHARPIAEETPVAIECNGIGYAVLMASPADLIDLAYGFAFTERLIDATADVLDHELFETDKGFVLRLTLAKDHAERLVDRVRHRTTDSSCGLCGIANLEQALRPLPQVSARWRGHEDAIFGALRSLDRAQPLNAITRAVHAAAACASDGTIRLVREDVGRHNAFDKLIGAMLRDGLDWDGGFALLTSRCSYELVEKAVLSNCPLLATISAPTGLAIQRAAEAGLQLRTLVRADAMLRPA